ncbi:hypothetical protein ACFWN2_40185 [Lentzea sp. NPDC058436]|uniref:hypothetical protein n=1 Tax=Lentzea sp. NPDC058436 TaxID=3346499 RepID=UPI003653ECED
MLVVASPDYVKALGSDDVTDHLGVRYEAGLVRQKIYDHSGADGCTVLPIVPPGTDLKTLSLLLRSLVIHRFDPHTLSGVEELVQSLRH